MLNDLLIRFRALFRRKSVEGELDDEIRFHFEQQVAKYIASGVPRDEATRRARLEFGGLDQVKEECRDARGVRIVDTVSRDIRYALRMLMKSPGFTAVAVIALALGIGTDTAMYTIVNGALSWDMGLDNRDEVVAVASTSDLRNADWSTSYPDFRDFRSQQKSLAGLAAYQMGPVNVSDADALPERYYCVEISANGFSVVGQKPLIGRDFLPADERPGAAPVVMLGYHVWRDRYASNAAILGTSITVDEIPRTVIGVMPPGRRFPEETDLWVPLVPDAARERRDNRSLILFGHLRKGVPVSAVRAEITSIAQNLATQYPTTNKGVTAVVVPIMQLTGLYFMKPMLLVLFAAVGFVLLIACADVANMLLARATERAREISIRVAIGAGKFSILRQLLIESVVLSAIGGLLAWPVAIGGLRWFDSGTGPLTTKPIWLHLTLDRNALFYLATVAIGTGILFGLAPALRLAKTDISGALKEGGGSATVGSKSSFRLSNLLVAIQMALCVMLLVGAGLTLRSAMKMYAAPIGVDTQNVLTMRVELPTAKYVNADSWVAFHDEISKRFAALPGVELSGVASNLPMQGWLSFEMEFEGQSNDSARPPEAGGLVVSNNYFAIMRAPGVRGRLFSDIDGKSGPPVAIVNESFAAKFWPNNDALGKRVRIIDERSARAWFTVVGVVPDILQNFRDNLERDPLIYVPFSEMPQRQTFLIARTGVPPASLAEEFRHEVQNIDAKLPVFDVRTLDSRIAETRLSVSLFGAMCSVFAGIATILAAIGLYAVMAHAVNKRRREIGLRVALGATRADIAKLVLVQGVRPLIPGLVVGVVLALAASQLLRSVLRGVSPTDPATFAGTVLILIAAGVLGCVVPARRAMRVDPMTALRYE
jgi:putative ABC transport system permease protein